VRQDFSEIESGALSMSGLTELGLDPRALVTVRATDADAALRTLGIPPLHKLRLKVLDDANLTQEERQMILWDNAVKLFKLEKEAERARVVLQKAAE